MTGPQSQGEQPLPEWWDERHRVAPRSPEELARLGPWDDPDISPRRRALSGAVSRGFEGSVAWFQRHWLAIVNTFLGVFVGVALLSPLAYALGAPALGSSVFNVYHFFCAQTPSHSFFVDGYQVCLCARCLAIYSAVLIGGLLLALVRGRPGGIRGIPWKIWLLALVPMAIDGVTQLFGWRESNVALRLFTGGLFGFATAWFMLPQIEDATRDSAPAPQLATQQRRR